jgi:hypothetical protein
VAYSSVTSNVGGGPVCDDAAMVRVAQVVFGVKIERMYPLDR